MVDASRVSTRRTNHAAWQAGKHSRRNKIEAASVRAIGKIVLLRAARARAAFSAFVIGRSGLQVILAEAARTSAFGPNLKCSYVGLSAAIA